MVPILRFLLPCSSFTHRLIGCVKTLPSRLKLPPAQLTLTLRACGWWTQSRSSKDLGPTTWWLLVGTRVLVPASSLSAGSGGWALPKLLPWFKFHLQPSSLPSKASGQHVCCALAMAWCTLASEAATLWLDVRFHTETVQAQPHVPFCCCCSGTLPSLENRGLEQTACCVRNSCLQFPILQHWTYGSFNLLPTKEWWIRLAATHWQVWAQYNHL